MNHKTFAAVLLLVLGPSGVGKSTVIQRLQERDDRFQYIKFYTTRALRAGETQRVHVSPQEMQGLVDRGDVLIPIEAFGAQYGISRQSFFNALEAHRFAVFDWPIINVADVRRNLSTEVFGVYLQPPTLAELQRRLEVRGERDSARLVEAQKELEEVAQGRFDSVIDLKVTNRHSAIDSVVEQVRGAYLRSLTKPRK